VTPLLVQMSGAPGTGKSTLARAIAPQLHAAVLDHDLIKATLAEHMPLPALACAPATGARPDQAAGRASCPLAPPGRQPAGHRDHGHPRQPLPPR